MMLTTSVKKSRQNSPMKLVAKRIQEPPLGEGPEMREHGLVQEACVGREGSKSGLYILVGFDMSMPR